MNNPLNFGLLLVCLSGCRAAWVGYQARFKDRTDVLHNFNPSDYSDPNAAASIYGLNLFLLGLCGIFAALVAYAWPQHAKIVLLFYVGFAVICGGYFMYRGKQYAKT